MLVDLDVSHNRRTILIHYAHCTTSLKKATEYLFYVHMLKCLKTLYDVIYIFILLITVAACLFCKMGADMCEMRPAAHDVAHGGPSV